LGDIQVIRLHATKHPEPPNHAGVELVRVIGARWHHSKCSVKVLSLINFIAPYVKKDIYRAQFGFRADSSLPIVSAIQRLDVDTGYWLKFSIYFVVTRKRFT